MFLCTLHPIKSSVTPSKGDNRIKSVELKGGNKINDLGVAKGANSIKDAGAPRFSSCWKDGGWARGWWGRGGGSAC